jgi:hypothetical protein
MAGKALGRIPGCTLLTVSRLNKHNSNLKERRILIRLEGSELAEIWNVQMTRFYEITMLT